MFYFLLLMFLSLTALYPLTPPSLLTIGFRAVPFGLTSSTYPSSSCSSSFSFFYLFFILLFLFLLVIFPFLLPVLSLVLLLVLIIISLLILLLLLYLLDRPPSPDGILLVGWWSSSPQTEAKETLDSVPIELHLYFRPVLIAALLLYTRPDAPPPSPPHPVSLQSCLHSPLLSSLHPKRPDLPPPDPARL